MIGQLIYFQSSPEMKTSVKVTKGNYTHIIRKIVIAMYDIVVAIKIKMGISRECGIRLETQKTIGKNIQCINITYIATNTAIFIRFRRNILN